MIFSTKSFFNLGQLKFSKQNVPVNPKMNKGNVQVFTLPKQVAWLLLLSQSLNIACIAEQLTGWMLAIVGLFLSWQVLLLVQKTSHQPQLLQQEKRVKPKAGLPPLALVIFATLGAVAILLSASQLGALLSMVHLLCFSYVLKGFEQRKRKDFFQLVLLGLFVLMSSLVFKQNLFFSVSVLVILVINLSVLLYYFSNTRPVRQTFSVVSLLIVQSMILAVALFLFFPRLPPLWQMPTAKSAETGLSDAIQPGDIANLARSNKLAFRVEFDGNQIPDYTKLYWRAMTLEKYDGRKWQRTAPEQKETKQEQENQVTRRVSEQVNQDGVSPIVNYQVTVEPHHQRWLFSLPVAKTSNSSILTLDDYTFQSAKRVTKTKQYQVESDLSQQLSGYLSPQARAQNLSYPKASNPKLEALAKQLVNQFPDEEARASAVLKHFNQQNYYYTLQPPLLHNNSLDQFYFETKAGFCVHYASSFTFLMRAAGIPARVVTGYMGGEYNSAGVKEGDTKRGHLTIYQYDAHAWSEIWIKSKGWVRYDPTGAVDPSRVSQGFSEVLLQQQASLSNDILTLYDYKQLAWLNSLRQNLEALDYQWTKWVLGYSNEDKYTLLKRWFGEVFSWQATLIIALAIIGTMLLLVLFFYLKLYRVNVHQRLPIWHQLFSQVDKKLAKKGIARAPEQTANELALSLNKKSPELSLAFARFNQSYSQFAYQNTTEIKNKEKIKSATAKLKQHYRALMFELNKLPSVN